MLNTLSIDPVIGGVGSFVSETSSWATLAASLFIAAALLLSGRVPSGLTGGANMAVLVAFGRQLQIAHASPHGPIAFVLLITAAGVEALAPRAKRTSRQGCLRGCGLAREGPPFVEEIP